MTDQRNHGNEAAFPTIEAFHPQMGIQSSPGMSLRDWFAGMALASVYVDNQVDCERCAEYAYQLADAMLHERSLTDEERRNR